MGAISHTGLLRSFPVTAALVFGLTISVPVWGQQGCPSLPRANGNTITVGPAQAASLRNIVADADTGTTILLLDGVYDMSHGDSTSRLVFSTPGVTLRSSTGNPANVVLDGAYNTNELISIYASDVVIADVTLKRAYDHPIHISGLPGEPIANILIHGVVVIDPGQQAIKINANQNGYADYGTIECSRIQLTPQGRGQVRDGCYTGGIDAHKARGWTIRRNRIEGFWCQNGLSEHGIHFWSTSRDTLIEENSIINCARGIGLGLRETSATRSYPDNPYPNAGYLGHIDGIVSNNFISAFDPALLGSSSGFDVGIAMEQARGARILHNTVGSTSAPYSSIEWRFANTSVEIINNLVTHNLRPRDGAFATTATNLEYADSDWFLDLTAGELHLSPRASSPLNSGTVQNPVVVPFDIDHQLRDSQPDIGADEMGLPTLFRDGFESGTLEEWLQ